MSKCPFDPPSQMHLDRICPHCQYDTITELTACDDRWRRFVCQTCKKRWQIVVAVTPNGKGHARAEYIDTN